MKSKKELLEKQIKDITVCITEASIHQSYLDFEMPHLIIKRMDLEEKLLDITIKETILKSKTLKESFDTFKDLYKIESGEDYVV